LLQVIAFFQFFLRRDIRLHAVIAIRLADAGSGKVEIVASQALIWDWEIPVDVGLQEVGGNCDEMRRLIKCRPGNSMRHIT
jgi:hypothetical protein